MDLPIVTKSEDSIDKLIDEIEKKHHSASTSAEGPDDFVDKLICDIEVIEKQFELRMQTEKDNLTRKEDVLPSSSSESSPLPIVRNLHDIFL
jgi:hypothetical protein